jgi:hypothetical protein
MMRVDPGQDPNFVPSRPGTQPIEPLHPWTQEERAAIAALAYQLWQERGSPHGSDWEDWFRAEQTWRHRLLPWDLAPPESSPLARKPAICAPAAAVRANRQAS